MLKSEQLALVQRCYLLATQMPASYPVALTAGDLLVLIESYRDQAELIEELTNRLTPYSTGPEKPPGHLNQTPRLKSCIASAVA